jgi:hypothetical protein
MAEMRLYSAGASSEVELASALVLDWKESLALPAGPRPLRDPWLYDSCGPEILVFTHVSKCQTPKLYFLIDIFEKILKNP